ncbi:hypothetical protein ACFLZU_05230 [Thermodesulfobacteriota bacterium]
MDHLPMFYVAEITGLFQSWGGEGMSRIMTLILPAATAMTIPWMAPISSSVIFCSLATPR